MTSPQLTERDRAEIQRSAAEARQTVLRPADVDRYLDPPAATPYALEFAFHLLGDVRGKNVLDFGCGTGESVVPLTRRGAQVMGIDISPELIALAERRIKDAGVEATLRVGSAYATGLPNGSVDAIFCVALIHHLDIAAVRDEMLRILAKNGVIILSEPIRFSAAYNRLRGVFAARDNISEHEHPLTKNELATFTEPFKLEEMRYFRLPLLPLMARALPFDVFDSEAAWRMDRWILRYCRAAEKYATNVTMRLRKTND